jgi:antitoxin component of RelBE/YafQ-DinJ toxin-antitoxin module
VTSPTESVAARIESDSKTQLTRAAEECDLTVSAYLESVIEEHINRNPHNLRALESSTTRDPGGTTTTTREESPDGFVEEMLEGLE